jgi:hypothetical protein
VTDDEGDIIAPAVERLLEASAPTTKPLPKRPRPFHALLGRLTADRRPTESR